MSDQQDDETSYAMQDYAPDSIPDNNPSTKLARRRRIEDLHAERLLREEIAEYELSD